MKSYGQRCIRMPPLRGGQSLVHLCLSAVVKSAAARRIIRPGTCRSIVGVQDAHQSVAKLTLRVRFATGSIVGRRRGGLRARYASSEMLAALRTRPSSLGDVHTVQVGVGGSLEICIGTAASRFARRAAGRWCLHTSVQVGTSRAICHSGTNPLAKPASFVEIPSVSPKECARRPLSRR
jgi:hypothetical protein